EHARPAGGADLDREQDRLRPASVQRRRHRLQHPARGLPGRQGGRHVRLQGGSAARNRRDRARSAQGVLPVTRKPPPLLRIACCRFHAPKPPLTMATNFFQQQDSARRKTFRLVVYFVLAILILIALVYGLLLALSMYGAREPVSWWQPELLLLAAPGVGLVVGGASAFKVAQLASGGQAVALMLGGEEVPGTTTDPRQKRLLNVVEEMALAAGVPVPPVYVLQEPGINAFAAGSAPGDAVVAVSQGGLNYLARDELQGVVAHECSHILNGDMRLNIRLIGLIFGIMALSIMGRMLMFTSGRSSGRNDSRGGLMLLGLGVFVLGLVGAFFGRLIMAAVSRQREYLADASAVQFTRNPGGIGGGA